jgi:hypothetical protein
MLKSEDIPVTGRGDPQGCETSRLPYFLGSRLTDGGQVTLTRRQPFFPSKIAGTHFCQRLSGRQGHSAAGWMRSTEESNDLIENGTSYLPACSMYIYKIHTVVYDI